MSPQPASLRAKLLLSLGAFVVCLGLLELAFRFLGIRGHFHMLHYEELVVEPGTEPRPTLSGFIPNSIIRTIYGSDPRGYFDPGNSIDHHFNSVGWRDVEHTVDKPPGTFRILGLGDSYLFGQGVRREDICLTLLGKSLQAEYPQVRVETINSGLRSLNTAQERDILLQSGLAYQPDLVILHFVLNDVEKASELFMQRPRIEFTEEYVQIYNTPDTMSQLSYLWGWVRQRIQQTRTSRSYIRDCVSSFQDDASKWQQCQAALQDIESICRRREIPLLVVVFPFFIELDRDYPFQVIHEKVRAFCTEKNIHVLDLRDSYSKFNGPELWVHPTDQHPNEQAHAIAAKAIQEYLTQHNELIQFNVDARPPVEKIPENRTGDEREP